MADQPKIGIYFWDQGGAAGRALGLEALAEKLAKAKGVAKVGILEDVLSESSLDPVRQAAGAGEIDRVLWIGPFSPEQQTAARNLASQAGLNPYMQEFLDLRDQGLLMEGMDEAVRAKKADLCLKMILARVRLLVPLEKVEVEASDGVLVIGAGVAGLHTADSLAKLGKRVVLVEKQSGVGGKMARLSRFYPLMCDPRCGLEFVLDKLRTREGVRLDTLSEVTSLTGCPGCFEAVVASRPRYVDLARCNGCGECGKACPVDITETVGAMPAEVGDAPLWQGMAELRTVTKKAIHPAEPMAWPTAWVVEREHCPPGCRKCAEACPSSAVVLDQEPSEATHTVGAALVATGWDPYPLTAIKEAEWGYGRYSNVVSNLDMERLLGPEAPAAPSGFTLADLKEVGFIQCAGSRDENHLKYCSSVCCSATLKQVLAFKEINPEATCYVFYQHIRTPGFDEEMYRKAREAGNVVFVRERPAGVKALDDGRLEVEVSDPLLAKKLRARLDLLVLAGGMCPSEGAPAMAEAFRLPTNEYGYFQAHRQCYPQESQRTGVYVGGSAREPMNVAQSIESSHRAAMDALGFLGEKILVEPQHPVVDRKKCDKCGRCIEECPFQALSYDKEEFPELALSKCRQCGNCMGICPMVAISLPNRTIKQYAVQVETMGDTSSFMGKDPLVVAFLCENDALYASRDAAAKGILPPNVVTMAVPCAGAVNNAIIADALSYGIDGVFIGACGDGQCHFVRGNELVNKRRDDLGDKLKKMAMESERIRFEAVGIRDGERYAALMEEFLAQLREMGPNPFKL